jgi:hypothetical protein
MIYKKEVFDCMDNHPRSFIMFIGLFHPIIFRFLSWRYKVLNEKENKRLKVKIK